MSPQADALLGLLQQITENTEISDVAEAVTGLESQIGKSDSIESPEAGVIYKVVGPTAAELESLKELIHFDHEYYKVAPGCPEVVVTTSTENMESVEQETTPRLSSGTKTSNTTAPKIVLKPADTGMVSIVSPHAFERVPLQGGQETDPIVIDDCVECEVSTSQSPQPIPEDVQPKLESPDPQVDSLELESPASCDPQPDVLDSFELSLGDLDFNTLAETLNQFIDVDLLSTESGIEPTQSGIDPSSPGQPVVTDFSTADGEPTPKRRRASQSTIPKRRKSSTEQQQLSKTQSSTSLPECIPAVKEEPSFCSNVTNTLSLWDDLGSSFPGCEPPTSPFQSLLDNPFVADSEFGSLNTSGYGSDQSILGSPRSDSGSSFGDSDGLWQESFTELFPSLM